MLKNPKLQKMQDIIHKEFDKAAERAQKKIAPLIQAQFQKVRDTGFPLLYLLYENLHG
ncbi:MAG: hypothetical protein M0000_07280 [Actinomycetota bacterium]|nr:hypothetical protein [Actinomycetota bacterium]